MAAPVYVPIFHWANISGVSSSGYKLNTYYAGTSTPQTTWTDATLTVANANPVILDATGNASVWIGTGIYKFVLTDASNNVLWTADQVSEAGVPSGTQSEWVVYPGVATFISATQFSVTGDATATLTPGRGLAFNSAVGGNFVKTAVFGAGITTVTVAATGAGYMVQAVPNPLTALFYSTQAPNGGAYSQPKKTSIAANVTGAVNLVTATAYTFGNGSPWATASVNGDDFAEYNSGTGAFTVKNTGRYLAACVANFNVNGGTVTNPGAVSIYINGGSYTQTRCRFALGTGGTFMSAHTTALLFLGVGDIVTFRTDVNIAFSAGTPQSAEVVMSLVQVY